ncbi:transglutaminase-like domain-containing protein [Umezawaea sp. Da 62-37]|uniref:transglutaminase-like domain-containing protein n=1 Tax=Umezawaea sp. Da 62-37 TaxID=3075927 RepID=UPI0028F73133|nr:transglutaminase-like domain-containing protein [Umezawaea sp. Da 62-37]WNV88639.1 transglutaminase-like domain-containing protein [Umezawaea sp. Da 62-37]
MTDYTTPGPMTSAGKYSALLDALPHDVAGLAAAGHGLLIHEHIAPNYGVELSDADRAPVHLRRIEDVLDRIVSRDDRPLTEAREPGDRIAGNCRHFTVLLVTALRARGVPARARCGFGGYFGGDAFEDHWVAEYRNAEQDRWVLVDGQIDDVQRGMFPIDFDLLDVPRDRFLVAGDAWLRCRAGTADPSKFGLTALGETGSWWIAGNLVRDAASLLGTEVLPWDGWGAMPGPQEEITGELAELFDRLAALTLTPDESAAELRELCRDERLRLPATVRNHVRGTEDAI